MDSELDQARRWLESLDRRHRATLSVIRDHPFVASAVEGNASLEHLRRFAVAEYLYMRGGVKHFALSILNSPDLETHRFFHERLSGELEYLSRFRPFMEAVELTDREVARIPRPQEP